MKKKKTMRGNRFGRHILIVTLIVATLISGLLIVRQSFLRLDTYTQLTELRLQQDRELSEHSRLLIEKESLSSYAIVQEEAQSDGMVYPVELVKPAEGSAP
ncbi:MAG: cell division protein FtsL [Gammaproteobacteria bacterium]|nr:cell division protein FtsL [Gammaproteobacteria bacterium]